MAKRPFQAHQAHNVAPPHSSRSEAVETVHGLRAALAVFARRRDDVLRVAYARSVRGDVGEFGRWAESRRLPFVETTDAELDRLAESTHHEGLCVVARPRRWLSTQELTEALARNRGLAIALDRVRNPYNVGAILRSAAFLGLDAALLGAPAPHPALAPAAVRVAEGAAEHIDLARTTDLGETLGRLRSHGIQIVGADGSSPTSAIGFAFRRPALLVVGHEREGLGDRVRGRCDSVVSIPGSGRVESLNVAVAAGILMAQMKRDA
jgi:TrmH RNA methyltransferase